MSRLAPMPLINSSGGRSLRLPEIATRSRTPSTSTNWISREGTDTGDISSHDESLNGLGAFVGVQGLHVGHVPYDVEVEQDAVTAEQIASFGHNLASLARVVHLRDGGDGVGETALFDQPAKPKEVQLHRAHLCQHLDQLVLHDLEADQRLAELRAFAAVLGGDLVRGRSVPEG